MIEKLSCANDNPQIAALESVFCQTESPVQSLVIAHNDPHLVASLPKALAGQLTAVLHVSQDAWDFKTGEYVETIEWALQRGAIRNLLLVGSSHAAGPLNRASLIRVKSNCETGYDKLLAGVRCRDAHSRAVQESFAAHVQQILQIPVVHNRWREGELAVCGLFHRAESGLFLNYDIDADTFRPLFV